MRPEYDFSGGVRGKYAEGYRQQLTAIVEREGDGFVSLGPELDIASQGDTPEEARANLEEALELFFEIADDSEVCRRPPGVTGQQRTLPSSLALIRNHAIKASRPKL